MLWERRSLEEFEEWVSLIEIMLSWWGGLWGSMGSWSMGSWTLMCMGGLEGFHGRVLDHDFNVGVGDFVVVECVGVSDESALGDPTCGCC